MYKIIKNVIGRGSFDLKSILTKIDTLWSEDKLTDEQRDELLSLARGGASTGNSVDLLAKITELEQRIRVLESAATTPDTETGTESGTETVAEYADGKWYYAGDKVLWNGQIYVCIAPDQVVCVWSPDAYPAYWEVTE